MKELRELRQALEAAIKPGHDGLVDAIFGLLENQVERCNRLEKETERLRQRIRELEQEQEPPSPTAPKESYSLDAEEKRRQRKRRKRKVAGKRKPGRKPKQTKLDRVVRWVEAPSTPTPEPPEGHQSPYIGLACPGIPVCGATGEEMSIWSSSAQKSNVRGAFYVERGFAWAAPETGAGSFALERSQILSPGDQHR